jgi:hypothetical protein
MLDWGHYELLAKYDSSETIDFDVDELANVSGVLNLSFIDLSEARLPEYRTSIAQAIHEQNEILTELGGEYLNLDNLGSRIEALRYVVQNIAKIKSPFMLDAMAGLIGHRADSPLRYGRGRHSETAALAGPAKNDSQS